MSTPYSGARTSRVLLAVLVCAGWILHDLAKFAHGGDPSDALALLPGCLAILLGAALFGWMDTKAPRLLPVSILLLLVATALSIFFGLEIPPSTKWLPRALLLLIACYGICVLRSKPGDHVLALQLGLVACLVATLWQGKDPLWLPAIATIPLLSLAARFLPVHARGSLFAVLALAAIAIGTGYSSTSESLPLASPAENKQPDDRPNLVLIVLDTVRADHFTSYGFEHRTTPRIDAFFAEYGTRFERARAASSWTLPSHASLFTGRLPSEHGAEIMGGSAAPLREDTTTIAETLQENGYQTGAVVSNLAYFSPRIGLDRGFDHFDNRSAGWSDGYLPLVQLFRPNPRIGNSIYRRAESITDSALEWLEGRSEDPFLLFLNYMDAHDPLLPPPSDLFGETVSLDPLRPLNQDLKVLYERSLFHLDEHVGRFLNVLEEQGLLENTAVVLTGDHGEGLGDRNFRGHGRHLYEELIHVPLFIKPIDERTAEVETKPISAVQVHDEMLRLVGLTPPVREANPIVSEWRYIRDESEERREQYERVLGKRLDLDLLVWSEENLKFIVASDGTVEAYDLGLDPKEERPLELSPTREAEVVGRALRWWADHPVQTSAANLSEEEKRALKNLGYTD